MEETKIHFGRFLLFFRLWLLIGYTWNLLDINQVKMSNTAWKVSKYVVFSGPYFPVNTGKYGPEKTLYLDTFHAVKIMVFTWNSGFNDLLLTQNYYCFEKITSFINPIQDGGGGGGWGGEKGPLTSFSPVTSTNVEISPPKLSDF